MRIKKFKRNRNKKKKPIIHIQWQSLRKNKLAFIVSCIQQKLYFFVIWKSMSISNKTKIDWIRLARLFGNENY